MYEYKLKNIRVIDGDTIEGDLDLGFNIILSKQQIRLYGIDTPESRTKDKVEKIFGLVSKNRLEDLLDSECVIKTHKDETGKFGRILAEPLTSDGESICDILIRENYAVKYLGKNKDEIEINHMVNRNELIMKGKVNLKLIHEAERNENKHEKI